MIKTLRIGMLGCGVVGGGVVEALHLNANHMEAQFGFRFELVRVVVRDFTRLRTQHFLSEWLESDWRRVTEADDIDIVIEAIGGITPAYEAIVSALRHGKHVVTANKELLATFGDELFQVAKQCNRQLLFEASVLGGIPALHALQTYFAANRVTRLRGIMNGTTNYILTRMGEEDLGFAQALAEAQAAGYAEADPTADVEGFDARYKLQILIRQAFAADVDTVEIEMKGISGVEAADLVMARELGCKLKLVAEAALDPCDGKLAVAVRPVLLGNKDALYHVDDVQNALCVTGNLVGDLVFMGPGAGAFPTASAVVEDLVKIACTSLDRETARAVELDVKPVRATAYLVRRKCDLGPCAGELVTHTLLQVLGGQSAHYLSVASEGVEGWAIFLSEERTASDVLKQVAKVLAGVVECYPIYGAVIRPAQVRETVVAAG